MSIGARKYLIAWLGLVAMGLIVLAPVVSQLVVAAHRVGDTESALCSTAQSPSGGIDHSHAERLAACAYCGLLADHGVVPTLPTTLLPALLLASLVGVAALSTRHVPSATFPSGRPRAPPRVS
ncbi:DUF2946 domain-containing protein [Paraburkholderia sp.]|uniref:DUF2946 domain-containing protein n=1 Tax=Paraburkholderia sp. TaxID=1926495 RepID=UPI00239F08A0|nr:DUF2946 domain-containing protein [Paraburkholderia sp.]MDE1180803.1 DUF2946 domain-containing protein [Paraburkholderia sp.]